ncbi:MAG: type 1 glutamine amidotransferase domain-containing protein [Pseudomonadota bacterium]|nr:hypothetical protein [Pseudomonadales bacterium]MDY6919690.1 type 1 glutamine amidotransferase domain-containing protein [Pseudomonadota bacterium]
MTNPLNNRHVAFLATNGFEQSELTHPWETLRAAGADTTLVSLENGEIKGKQGGDAGDTFPVDATVDQVSAGDFDALVLPGGLNNPDTLRTNPQAVKLVSEFVASGKPVAAICHGPWLLVEAGAADGKVLTSYPSLKTDIINAGGTWVDEEVKVDGNLITSRTPQDLDAFGQAIIDMLAG